MEIIRTKPATRQHSPTRLAENHRAPAPIPPGSFHVETRDEAGATYLADEHVGTFASVMRHAMVCARSIRARFDLPEACCDVVDANGALVYSVSAYGGGIRLRTIGGAQ